MINLALGISVPSVNHREFITITTTWRKLKEEHFLRDMNVSRITEADRDQVECKTRGQRMNKDGATNAQRRATLRMLDEYAIPQTEQTFPNWHAPTHARRDIKPKNILVDRTGYILTKFVKASQGSIFVDFSSAFNTIQPHLTTKPSTWSHSHLYNPEQQSLRFVEHPYNFNSRTKH